MADPSPRSPPPRIGTKLPAEVQILDREIGFLKEELQSVEGLQPVSQCCKEVHEFIGSNPDPLIQLNKKKHKSCSCWEWIRAKLCFNCSWICCCSCACALRLETLNCSCRRSSNCSEIFCCRPCFCCRGCSCGCVWSCCRNCTEISLCPSCTKTPCDDRCQC